MNNSTLTTFYIIRHGQTDWNKQQLLQGHTDIPLNEEGERQAKNLATVLKDVPFDLAFSSDLLRAKRTAEIILLEKQLHIETTKLLRERLFGEFEGKPVAALLAEFKLLKALNAEQRKKYRLGTGIESDEELTTRLITFLRETAITHPDKTILIATHGGILRMVLLHLGYMTYEQSDNKYLENGSYVKLETDGVDFFLKEIVGVKDRALPGQPL